ncbi:hypothetical protein ACW9HJ_31470 [Nocardia gipuzkoensis]
MANADALTEGPVGVLRRVIGRSGFRFAQDLGSSSRTSRLTDADRTTELMVGYAVVPMYQRCTDRISFGDIAWSRLAADLPDAYRFDLNRWPFDRQGVRGVER